MGCGYVGWNGGMVGAITGGSMGYIGSIGVIYYCGDFREPATATRVGRSKRKRGVVAFGKRCSTQARVLVPVVWQLRREYGARATVTQSHSYTVTQSHSRQSHRQQARGRARKQLGCSALPVLTYSPFAVLPSCRLSVATHGDASDASGASDATEDAKHLIWRSQRLASCLNRRAWRLKNG